MARTNLNAGCGAFTPQQVAAETPTGMVAGWQFCPGCGSKQEYPGQPRVSREDREAFRLQHRLCGQDLSSASRAREMQGRHMPSLEAIRQAQAEQARAALVEADALTPQPTTKPRNRGTRRVEPDQCSTPPSTT